MDSREAFCVDSFEFSLSFRSGRGNSFDFEKNVGSREAFCTDSGAILIYSSLCSTFILLFPVPWLVSKEFHHVLDLFQ